MTSEKFVRGQYKDALVIKSSTPYIYDCKESFMGKVIATGKNPSNAWTNARKKVYKKLFEI